MQTETNAESEGKSFKKLIAFGAIAIGLIVTSTLVDIPALMQSVLGWIDELGTVGVAVFIGIYVAATVLFIPGSLLTLGAGVVFGVVWGSIYVSIASTVGAALCFIIGRNFAREAISKKIEGNQKFSAVDKAVAGEGWKIVLLTRLSPIFPFNLLNYAFGLTQVKFKDYVLASWIGMMPGTVMYVYLGSLAGDIASLGAGRGEKTSAEWILTVVGLLATIAVTVYVTKIARKALSKHAPELSE